MIALGYVVFFLYMGLLIVVGEAVQKKFNLDKELCRKAEHLGAGLSWFVCYLFTGNTIHTFIINVVGLILLAVITFGGLMKSVQREDADKSYGLFFFGLSTCIVMGINIFVNQDFYWYTGIAFCCMAFGDGLAPFVARWAKNRNLKITEKKTLAGAVTVFFVSALFAYLFSLVCQLNLPLLFCLSLGALTAVVELFSEKCTDNLTIDLCVFGYLVLYHYGLATPALQIALLVAFPLVLLNGGLKALTPTANLIAWLYVITASYFGGLPTFVTVIALYILSAIVGKTAHRIHRKKYGEKLSLSRNAVQILATAGATVACTIAHFFTGAIFFLFASYAVIAEQFADTIASDIGKLSKNMPRNIIGFEKMTAKVSGGVSVLGSLSALLASAVATVIPFFFQVFAWELYPLLLIIAFLGTVLDSIFGSLLQVLYRCPICNELTEKKVHCNQTTLYEKGIRSLGNCGVNFISGVGTVLLCLPVLLLL